MARPKGSASALGDLPVDPLVDILSRVPAKSVCQFKCVSKAWRDLIADPDHRKKLPQAMQGLFCKMCEYDKSSMANRFSFVDLTARSVPLDIDPSFSFLTGLPEIQDLVLLDSCNGLILFEYHQYDDQDSHDQDDSWGYVVCNPTTKEWEVVPPLGCILETDTFLAFDPAVSSHFNLVQFQLEDEWCLIRSVHAYSSETGTWSLNQVDEQGEEGQLEGWRHHVRSYFVLQMRNRAPFVNGFLHLSVWDQDGDKIFVVDIQGKARRMVPVPHAAHGKWVCYFGESQGKLHYMTQEKVDAHERKFKLSIWVLQGYDTKEWVLKHTVDTHEVFGEDFKVLGIHRDFNVVFLTLPLRRKLVAYGMSNKEVAVIATFDDQRMLERELKVLDTDRYVPYFQELSVLTYKHRKCELCSGLQLNLVDLGTV